MLCEESRQDLLEEEAVPEHSPEGRRGFDVEF